MTLKERLMQSIRRLFGRATPRAAEPPIPTVHPNDDVRESIATLVAEIDREAEAKKSRSIEFRPPVTNGSH